MLGLRVEGRHDRRSRDVGRDLKSELEQIARQDFNADVTWLARKILREWLAARAPE